MENGKWKTENDGSTKNEKVKMENSQLVPASGNFPLSTFNSQLTATPFLGFTYLGTAPESDLIRDYEREFLDEQKHEQSRLGKLRKGSVVNMFLSPEYQRYLER